MKIVFVKTVSVKHIFQRSKRVNYGLMEKNVYLQSFFIDYGLTYMWLRMHGIILY